MEYTTIEEMLNNDTIRVTLDIPRLQLQRLDNYVKNNKMVNRKRLLEMIIIKFAIENTSGDLKHLTKY